MSSYDTELQYLLDAGWADVKQREFDNMASLLDQLADAVPETGLRGPGEQVHEPAQKLRQQAAEHRSMKALWLASAA